MAKKKRSAKQKANDRRLGAAARKRSSKGNPKSNPKRNNKRKNNPRKSKNMAKKKGSRTTKKSFTKQVTSGAIFSKGLLGKVVLGVGAGSITTMVLNQFAPQFANIGAPVAALLAGGPIGAVSQIVLGGGGLGSLGGILGSNRPVEELSV